MDIANENTSSSILRKALLQIQPINLLLPTTLNPIQALRHLGNSQVQPVPTLPKIRQQPLWSFSRFTKTTPQPCGYGNKTDWNEMCLSLNLQFLGIHMDISPCSIAIYNRRICNSSQSVPIQTAYSPQKHAYLKKISGSMWPLPHLEAPLEIQMFMSMASIEAVPPELIPTRSCNRSNW